jgi:hypothetical protein
MRGAKDAVFAVGKRIVVFSGKWDRAPDGAPSAYRYGAEGRALRDRSGPEYPVEAVAVPYFEGTEPASRRFEMNIRRSGKNQPDLCRRGYGFVRTVSTIASVVRSAMSAASAAGRRKGGRRRILFNVSEASSDLWWKAP